MVNPGDLIGVLTDDVQKQTGYGAIPVIAVAGHDTGSAVAAVPAKNEKFASKYGIDIIFKIEKVLENTAFSKINF